MCAYQFLAGRLPHEYTSLTELALKQQQADVEPITVHRPEIPPELDRAIRVCLERDPSARYPSTLEMARGLEAGLQGVETEATRRLTGIAAAAPGNDEDTTRALSQVTAATNAMRSRRTGRTRRHRLNACSSPPPRRPPAEPHQPVRISGGRASHGGGSAASSP